MKRHKLSDCYPSNTKRDGYFNQTQFANTTMAHSLCFVAAPKYLAQANQNESISCIITSKRYANAVSDLKGLTIVEQPEKSFYELHNFLYNNNTMVPSMEFSLHNTAQFHPTAVISTKTYIGKNVIVGPGAIIEDYSHIDDGVKIGPRAIIGASGHFYKKYDGELFEVKHTGGTWIAEGAQILAGAVISKAVHTDFTYIGKQTVISINAHIGHGCHIGDGCIVAGGAQISGFSTLGNHVWVGPSATITNLIKIGDNSRIEIGSVVINDVAAGCSISGNFAHDHKQNLRRFAKRIRYK